MPADELNVAAMPPARCPHCLKLQNAATHVENEPVRPEPGDFSLCFDCGAPLRFGAALELVPCGDLDDLVAAGELDVEQVAGLRLMQARIRRRAARGAS
jgi:hypothetical protein